MMDAEIELLGQGLAAIPILESLFSGEAKNQFGIPYRELGLPLRCGLEVARRLGRLAKPLEAYLREELRSGNFVAAMALGALESLEDESISSLAFALNDSKSVDLPYESACALIRCGQSTHPTVTAVTSSSIRAAKVLEKVTTHFAKVGQNV